MCLLDISDTNCKHVIFCIESLMTPSLHGVWTAFWWLMLHYCSVAHLLWDHPTAWGLYCNTFIMVITAPAAALMRCA